MGGARNRKAGHSYELKTAKRLREDLGWEHVVTSRSESRTRDDQKVDLINHDEFTNGRMPFDVQCKNTTVNVNYHKLMGEMPDLEMTMPVILHKKTQKAENGVNFITVGEYSIMKADDWYKLMKELEKRRKNIWKEE
tara:strand:+ start:17755 stop:18165 length:411 start_codon:yes stop_codon:yes gene_type:complete